MEEGEYSDDEAWYESDDESTQGVTNKLQILRMKKSSKKKLPPAQPLSSPLTVRRFQPTNLQKKKKTEAEISQYTQTEGFNCECFLKISPPGTKWGISVSTVSGEGTKKKNQITIDMAPGVAPFYTQLHCYTQLAAHHTHSLDQVKTRLLPLF